MKLVEVESNGDISTVWLSRVEKRNALNRQMVAELAGALRAFEQSSQRAVVIAARGDKAFCSGADLGEMPDVWRCVPGLGLKVSKPVVVAVHGQCIAGGLLFPIFADLCVASEDANFLYPDARLGITGGVVAALAARIPHKAAMEMIYLGRSTPARRAYEMGLVNQVVSTGQHVEAAQALAADLASFAPLVLSTLKRFVHDVLPLGPSEKMIRARLELESVANSQDAAEGTSAHAGRRKAIFRGT